jgi:hypothetical protein
MAQHININGLSSLASAREASRDIAGSLGFSDRDLRQVLNIVTEIAFACMEAGGSGDISLNGIEVPDLCGICIVARFPIQSSTGAGTADTAFGSPSLLWGGVKNLSDHFETSRSTDEIFVRVVKWATIRKHMSLSAKNSPVFLIQ